MPGASPYDVAMRKRRVVVRVRRGPAWGDGPPEAQPDWDEHAAWVDALVKRGTFVLGGPFSDNSGSMVVLEGIHEEEAARVFATDPFVTNGVFVIEDVREWTNYVDTLSGDAQSPADER